MNIISTREDQVLHLIAKELTMTEIAKQLYISYETVRSHRKSIMIKLNAKNTAGLIYKAIQIGLLVVGPPSNPTHMGRNTLRS